MNDRQRVLVVVALGLAIAVVTHTWDATISSNDGWFAYAPNTAPIFSNESSDIVRSGVMWFVAVVLWAGCSFWILRGQDEAESKD